MEEETVQCYKQTLNVQTTVRVLCDTSYIIYLAARYNNHRDLHNNNPLEQNAHADVMRSIGVERIDLDTTKCVVEALKADFRPDQLNSRIQPHVIKCAMAMRALVCDHLSRPVSLMDCMQSMMERRYERHILVSNDEEFYKHLQERFRYKLPILTVIREGFVLLPLGPQKRKLQIEEEKEAAEDAQEALNKQVVSEKGKEKLLEEEASKVVGIVMEKTSRKGKQK